MATNTVAIRTGAASNAMAPDAAAAYLPPGVVLGAGERPLQSASFRFSIPHFFLSSRHTLTSDRLVGDRPNVLFGVLTMGSETFSSSLINMVSVGTSTRIQVLPLSIGLIMLALAAGNVGSYWLGLLIGALFCLAAFQAVFRVVNRDGQTVEVRLSIFDRGKARAFANRINAAIAAR